MWADRRTLSCVYVVVICRVPFGSPLVIDTALIELRFSCPSNPEDINNQTGVLFQYHVEIKCVKVSSIGVHVITRRGITVTIGERVPVLKLEMEYITTGFPPAFLSRWMNWVSLGSNFKVRGRAVGTWSAYSTPPSCSAFPLERDLHYGRLRV